MVRYVMADLPAPQFLRDLDKKLWTTADRLAAMNMAIRGSDFNLARTGGHCLARERHGPNETRQRRHVPQETPQR
jgi:hypothetical protein